MLGPEVRGRASLPTSSADRPGTPAGLRNREPRSVTNPAKTAAGGSAGVGPGDGMPVPVGVTVQAARPERGDHDPVAEVVPPVPPPVAPNAWVAAAPGPGVGAVPALPVDAAVELPSARPKSWPS